MSFLLRVGLQDTDQLSQNQNQKWEERQGKKRVCSVPTPLRCPAHGHLYCSPGRGVVRVFPGTFPARGAQTAAGSPAPVSVQPALPLAASAASHRGQTFVSHRHSRELHQEPRLLPSPRTTLSALFFHLMVTKGLLDPLINRPRSPN